jgi:large subunit ribosomal protein L7e
VEAHRAKARSALKVKRVGARKVQFKRAEQYVKEFRTKERSLIHHHRIAKSTGGYYRPAEERVALVVRIRGINNLHPKPRKTLQLLRLRQIGNAVLLKLNKATLNMLKLVAPYVTWGYPSQKTISDLVYKRGFASVQGQRLPITSNQIVEDNLGTKDILCVEDLIHELSSCGENFRYANRFLWPFKLNAPRGGYKSVTTGFNEGGDSGLRGDKINSFVSRCL